MLNLLCRALRKLAVGIVVFPFFVLFPAVASDSSIPLADFFQHAEFGDAAISPTGRYLAVTVPSGERRNLAVLDLNDPAGMSVTAAFELRGGESPVDVRWVADERLIFTTIMQAGSLAQPVGTGRIYAINADGSNRRQLFGTQAGSVVFRMMSILSYLPNEPDWILIQHWAHDRTRPIVERLNVNNARTSRVMTSPLNRGSLMVDQQNRVRFAMGWSDDMRPEFAWRPDEESDWHTFVNEFSEHLEPIAFDSTGKFVYMRSRAKDKLGLLRIELATGAVSTVFDNNRVEIDGVKRNVDGSKIVGIRLHDGIPSWHTLEETFETQWLRQLEAMFEGSNVTIYNWTRDGKRAMVGVSSDVAPMEFFLLDTEAPALRFLAGSMPWIDPAAMRKTTPIEFAARDGLTLHGYKTLPAQYSEGEPVPFVVFVHGGPHGPRDRWGFDPWVQLFAHHGFGVLQVNFRGSGGYGAEFEQAGYLQWGGKMQDDITDGTHWIIEQGFADEDAVCIAGGSYGGYSTLVGITKEPDLYACAWAFVGVYDLELMKTTGDIPETEAGRRYLDRVLGTNVARLRERSPTNYVEKIKTPLFISHGAEDIRAHVDHYHLLKERLDAANIPYEEMLVEGVGHGFYKVENNVAMMERVLRFMKQHTQPSH